MPDNINKFVVIILVAVTVGAIADTQKEIDHLLGFVAKSSCKYERNGTMYDGVEAKNHIKKKYDYYLDKISSAEDFIKFSATESLLSGKKYIIHCPNMAVQKSGDWLLDELNKYRMNQTD